MEKAKVYFLREVTEQGLVKVFNALNFELKGKVAVKLHSGERGNQNYLRPEFVKKLVNRVNGTVVECNTAYGHDMGGYRNTTESHLEVIEEHGWNKYFDVDILDSEGPDLKIDVPNGNRIKANYVGKNIINYDSMLVLSHFKGHPMGGYGGALKQLSIGIASADGKAYIHTAGRVLDQYTAWDEPTPQGHFLESMADAASSVVKHFDGNIAYVNAMCNLSVDCDCCNVAKDPCMKDIGVLASLDPVAIDKACVDLIYSSDDPGKKDMIERIETRNGTLTIDYAEKLGIGTTDYELIEI